MVRRRTAAALLASLAALTIGLTALALAGNNTHGSSQPRLRLRERRADTTAAVPTTKACPTAPPTTPPPTAVPWRESMKIYIYELPADFNTNIAASPGPKKFPCIESMYGAEVLIHRALLKSPMRTLNPDEADYFFVPLYATCFRSHLIKAKKIHNATRFNITNLAQSKQLQPKLMRYFLSAMDYIKHRFPYWRRYNGRDHIVPFTHDFGACFTFLEEDTWKPESQAARRELHNAILLQYLGHLDSPCFSTWKDIVIPPHIKQPEVRGLRGGSGAGSVRNKTIGAFFRGKLHDDRRKQHSPGYGEGFRMLLANLGKHSAFFNVKEDRSPSYIREVTSSRFCLAPPGFAPWSPRLAESVVAGCVPVVLGDNVELPFERLIDYDRFLIKLGSSDVAAIERVLTTMPAAEVQRKADALHRVWPRFLYNTPSEPGDAVDSILETLALRLPRFKPVANRVIK